MAARGWRNWKLGVHRSEHNIDNFDTKSDKETQSPKLQLFKDIMRRETTRTEQQILLNEAERNSKKRKNRSLGRSSKTTPEKKDSKNHGLDQRVVVSQESVGLDSDSEAKSKICPLLNYCRPTYLGLACTAVAFLTLGTCGYIVACTFTPQTDIVMPSIDYLKKRSNLKHERNRKAGLSDFIGLNNVIGRRDWEDTHSKNDFVDLIESDYTDRDVDRFDNWAVKLDNQPNDKHLKDFYKRLLETDEQIKKLKMNLVNIPKTEDIDPKYQERHKRSTKLKLTGKIRRNKNQEKLDDQQNRSDIEKRESKEGKINVLTEKGRLKPINMYNRTNPLSIVMEKNQLIVQYKTDDEKKKLPKCTGSKAQKSHEENPKHPYHKNTERLDRILDQIIGSDMNYGDTVEQLFKKKKNKCKHPKINMEKNDKQKAHADHGDRNSDKTEESLEQMKKSDIIQGHEPSNTDSNVFTDVTDSQEDDFPSQFEEMSMPSPYPFPDLTKTTTTEEYRIFMGMTTMMDPSKRENKHRSPNARKLLQVEEDEEKLDLSYDDLKEVLADRVEDHDDQDRHTEKREKRQYESYEFMQPATHAAPAREENKFNIYNKNWKGAMPLYPDELNVIMSQSGLPGYKKDYGNKIQDNRPESNLRDVEYIDDYVNKFEKVGKVAQAYSDYGVFDGSNSKGSVLEKTHATEAPDNINVNPRNIAGEKKLMNMNNEIANKATVDIKNNNRLSKVVLTAGRLKRSVATLSEHDAIDKIVAIADDIKKKNTENLTKGKEGLSKPKGMKRNVEIEASGEKGNVKNDEENVNPIFGMIIGLLTSSASPIDQDSNRFSKNANATENFGRLSRTLMSYEENSENKTDSNSDNITDSSTRCPLGNSSISSVADSDSQNATVIIIEASTITNKERNVKNERSIKNDTMVKRSVKAARNPMFWTDMYDEEYGSDGVPFDEDVAVNSKPKRSDPDKKSSSWIGKKMQRLSNNFRKKSTVGDFMEPPAGPHRVVKREYKTSPSNKNKETDGKINFKALHSNMKEVCKKAVREVQQANNKGVAVNTGETSQAASSLMQQLVQLMSDLVDYQVQQRTCRKLPPDLQEFLQWLTAPAPGEDKRKVDRHSGDQDASLDDMWKNYITNEAATEDPDASRKYEDMAHSIEDLSQEYEAMSSSDKEKLSGVKGHLEAQLKYLHDMMDDNRSKRNIEQVRFRNFQKPPENVSQDKNLREIRQKRTFMRNFGKKHTRSTASYYEGDVNERVTDEGETKDERRRRREEENVRRKKNLRDVYYKALSDARKLTTAKSDIEIVTSNFL